jgi:hypothetical protein
MAQMSLGFCGNQLAQTSKAVLRHKLQTSGAFCGTNFQHILSVDFSIKSEKHSFFVLDLQGAWSSDIFNFIGTIIWLLYDGIWLLYDDIIWWYLIWIWYYYYKIIIIWWSISPVLWVTLLNHPTELSIIWWYSNMFSCPFHLLGSPDCSHRPLAALAGPPGRSAWAWQSMMRLSKLHVDNMWTI